LRGVVDAATEAMCLGLRYFPDETKTAQQGMYLVYLFAADLKTVALNLNQGVTELVRRARGQVQGRALLMKQTEAIRQSVHCPSSRLCRDLGSAFKAPLPRAYEAGNTAAYVYSISTYQTTADRPRRSRSTTRPAGWRQPSISARRLPTGSTARCPGPSDGHVNLDGRSLNRSWAVASCRVASGGSGDVGP
jgi:hypothetical protein